MTYRNLGATLVLSLPLGKTIGMAAILAGLLVGLTEATFRNPNVQKSLPLPSLGSGHSEFEYELAAVQALQTKLGRIDCLFMGSSMPDYGINPEVFAQAYQTETGQAIVCFNFSLEGIRAYTVGGLARLLANDLKPKLIIFGTSARDYADRTLNPSPAHPDNVVDSDWVQYRLGKWSVKGWLIDHSLGYRYLLRFEQGSVFNDGNSSDSAGMGGYGYNEMIGVDPTFDPKAEVGINFPNYTMAPDDLQGLSELLDLQAQGIQIVTVEMPVQPAYYQSFANGQTDYQKFTTEVTRRTQAHYIPFWRVAEQPDIPANGWWNNLHMNNVGAIVFSEWLGKRTGQFAKQVPLAILTH